MRVGLVRLSSPLFYDYSVEAFGRDGSPNPILDSPFGLMLLYDELWFLTKDLCPKNLRGASFVRILDEEGALPDLDGLDDPEPASQQIKAMYEQFQPSAKSFYGIVDEMRMSWPARPDNHGRRVQLGGLTAMGNAGTPENIVFDLAVLDRLDRKGVELVGNTVGQSAIESLEPAVRSADLAHVLVIDRIPNYLGLLKGSSRTGASTSPWPRRSRPSSPDCWFRVAARSPPSSPICAPTVAQEISGTRAFS
jgi:hypothetical protein